MITGESLIRTVNILGQEFDKRLIGSFCAKNPDAISMITEDYAMFDFIRNHNIMIQDLYGWSRIHRITKWKYKDPVKIWAIRFKDNQIFVHDDGLIPVWNPADPEIGFHGMIRYPYRLINPCTLAMMEENGWRMRLPVLENEFQHTTDISMEEKNDAVIYQIWTESGFYNVNGVQIFGSGYVDFSKIIVRKDFKLK